MADNPILDALTRRRNGGALGEGTPLRDAYGLTRRRRASSIGGNIEDFQQLEEIRAGASALPPQDDAADAFKQETQDAQQEQVTFEQAKQALDNAESELAQADQEAEIRRMEIDALPASPQNATNLRAAYAQLETLDRQREAARAQILDQRRRLASQEQAARDASKPSLIGRVLGEIKNKYAELPAVLRNAMEYTAKTLGGVGMAGLEALTFPGRVGMTAVGELGDLVGGMLDTEQQAKTREAQRQAMRLRAASAAEEEGGSFLDYATTGLGSYFRQQAERAGGAVEELTGPVLGPAVDPFELKARAINEAFGTEVSGKDIGGFVGRLATEIGADPTSLLGTGLAARGLRVGGAAASKVPGLVRAGKFAERLGATSELLGIGAKTRSALETTARIQAMNAVPELVAASPELRESVIAGKPLGAKLVRELGDDVTTGVYALASYDKELLRTRKALESLAERDPVKYADLVESTLAPFAGSKGLKGVNLAEQIRTVRYAEELRPKAAVASPVVAEALRDQAKLGQRLAPWSAVFEVFDSLGKSFPKAQAVGEWVRDAVIQQVPLGGPIARAFGAGKAMGATQSAEVYTAMHQFVEAIEKVTKTLTPDEAAKAKNLARQLTEFAGPQGGRESLAMRRLVRAGGRLGEMEYVPGQGTVMRYAKRKTVEYDAKSGLKGLMQWGNLSAKARRAAVEIADTFDLGERFILEFQQANGVAIAELADDALTGYFGRTFTPQMVRWLANNPEAAAKLGVMSDGEARAAWSVNEIRGRKLRGRSYEGADAVLRDGLTVPPDIKIFEDAPETVLKNNFVFAGKNVEKARMLDALAQELGTKGYGGPNQISRTALIAGLYDDVLLEAERRAAKGRTAQGVHELAKELNIDVVNTNNTVPWFKPGQPELTKQVVRDKLLAAREALSFRDPLDSARWIHRQLEARGLVRPAGTVSELEIAAEAGMLLPDLDDLERVVEMAGTFINKADVERYAKIAPGLMGKKPDEFSRVIWRLYDIMSMGLRRSILSTPSSVVKDLLSTQVWLAVAAKNPLAMFRHVRDAVRGKVPPEIITLLEREGVLTTRKTAEEVAATKQGGTFMERLSEGVKEKGYLGALAKPFDPLTKGRASKIASAIPNKLLEIREAGERVARIALYQERRAAGFSHREAVEDVYKYLGNFNDYASGKLDKRVLQRFFLFWSWNRKAIGFAMRGLLEHPLRAKMLMLLTAGNVQGEGDKLDRWARARGGFMLGRDLSGLPKVIPLGAGSYMSPLWGALNSESMRALGQGDPLAAGGKLLQDAARMGNPIWAGPAELAVNRDSFTGDQIYLEEGQRLRHRQFADHAPAILHQIPGLRELFDVEPVRVGGKGENANEVAYYRMSPGWKWFLEWTAPGAMSGAAQASGLVDPRRRPAEGILRITTGIPVYTVGDLDADRQRIKQMKYASIEFEKAVHGLKGRPFEVANDRVVANDSSELGQQLGAGMEEARQNAKRAGKDEREAVRQYLSGQRQEYLLLYDLGERLALAHNRLSEETQGLIDTGMTTPAKLGLRSTGVKLLSLRETLDQLERRLSPLAKKETAVRRKQLKLEDLMRGPESVQGEHERQQAERLAESEEREATLRQMLTPE